MNKKEKKLRKKLEKIEKKRLKKEQKESWAMYEPAGCYKCYNGQKTSGGKDALSITYYTRCECSKIKTKKYKKFLKNCGEMKVKEYEKILNKFYDNNSHIRTGNNATDRSW